MILPAILLLLILSGPTVSGAPQCPEGTREYYDNTGVAAIRLCCQPLNCPAGSVAVLCTTDDPSSSYCRGCEQGFYLPHPNDLDDYAKCKQQSTCYESHMYALDDGSTTDVRCACEDGYVMNPLGDACLEDDGVIDEVTGGALTTATTYIGEPEVDAPSTGPSGGVIAGIVIGALVGVVVVVGVVALIGTAISRSRRRKPNGYQETNMEEPSASQQNPGNENQERQPPEGRDQRQEPSGNNESPDPWPHPQSVKKFIKDKGPDIIEKLVLKEKLLTDLESFDIITSDDRNKMLANEDQHKYKAMIVDFLKFVDRIDKFCICLIENGQYEIVRDTLWPNHPQLEDHTYSKRVYDWSR